MAFSLMLILVLINKCNNNRKKLQNKGIYNKLNAAKIIRVFRIEVTVQLEEGEIIRKANNVIIRIHRVIHQPLHHKDKIIMQNKEVHHNANKKIMKK